MINFKKIFELGMPGINSIAIIFIAGYGIYNFIYALHIDFESILFAAFRYEGLLFYKNAILNNGGTFFYIRDWSTSFLPNEHPLVYFHNLDLIHFFAGFIQYNLKFGKIWLFTISLLVSIVGLLMALKYASKHIEKPFRFIFILIILVPLKAFNVAPQNLFLAVSLLVVIWHLTLLKRIWDLEEINQSFTLELLLCFLLAAVTETNLVILMIIITALFTIYSSVELNKLQMMKRGLAIIFTAAFPLLLLRILQLLIVKGSGYWEIYKLDVAYTSKIKVNSNINLIDAIKFYSQNGLTFFGQASQTISSNINELTSYYYLNYGYVCWPIVLFVAVLLLVLIKTNAGKNHKTSTFHGEIKASAFMAAYICFFTLASYAMIFLTGNAIIGLSLSKYGILYYQIIYNSFFIVFISSVLFIIFKEINLAGNFKTTMALIILPLIFIFCLRDALFKTRTEHFSYIKALEKVDEHSDVITNFEPSIIAIDAKSRANMSWYENNSTSCNLLNSDRLIKLYKVRKTQEAHNIYIFLCYYLPYVVGSKEITFKNHCLDKLQHETLYEDEYFGLYKINNWQHNTKTERQT